jgi:hypothetical protein
VSCVFLEAVRVEQYGVVIVRPHTARTNLVHTSGYPKVRQQYLRRAVIANWFFEEHVYSFNIELHDAAVVNSLEDGRERRAKQLELI